MGSTYGQDQKWFGEDKGWSDVIFFDSAGVVNKGPWGKVVQLVKIFRYSLQLGRYMHRHNVRAVFSVGGYSAAPGVFAAILFRKPLYIHEQNAKSGLLNRISKPFATEFFSSFDPDSICHDYPTGDSFYQKRRLRNNVRTVLFMGGSLGARTINDLAMETSAVLLKQGKRVIHLCGERDFGRVDTYYRTHGLNVTCLAFSGEIDTLLHEADFAVARAGASSLFELYANALPTLFIPYPHAASDHQFYNARYLEEQGMAYCIRENTITAEKLYTLLKNDHTEMSQKMLDSFKPTGTSCIVAQLLKKV